MEFTGIVQKGVIVLDDALSLPEGTRVIVSVDGKKQQPEALKELLMRFAGCMSDLPSDMAAQHDHYLHGTPKR